MKSLSITILKRQLHAGGGLEKYFRKVYAALVARGHRVTVLSMDTSSEVNVVTLSKRVPFSFLNMFLFDLAAKRWLARNPQDVILGWDRHFLPLTHYRAGNGCHAAFLERRKKESSWLKRVLLTCNPLHSMTLFSEKRTFESPTTITICNSNLVKNEILRFYPKACSKNIVVIHNGVEWQEMEHAFAQRESSAIPQLLFVGHEWKRKGLDRLLEALAQIEAPFHVTAIGKERSPEKFVALVKKYKLENKVTLIPHAQNPLSFYQKSSIMIIPSRYDPFANVTLEALSMGLFVITTEANGGAEVLTPESGIVLKETASPSEFASAIRTAMKMTLSPVNIRKSVEQFDFSKKLSEFVSLF